MSLGRKYDVNRQTSLLLREDTPGKYRKLTDNEIDLERDWSRIQVNGNMTPYLRDGSSTDLATPKEQNTREGSPSSVHSLERDVKKSKGGRLWKTKKSKSLSSKEELQVREPSVEAQGVESGIAPANKGATFFQDENITSLDVSVVADTNAEVGVVEADHAHITDPALADSLGETEVTSERKGEQPEERTSNGPGVKVKTERGKREKNIKNKDKKKQKHKKNTCEVHKNGKPREEGKIRKIFDIGKKKSDDIMSSPRHCRSCTCDAAAAHVNVHHDTSDTSSVSSSHSEEKNFLSVKSIETTSLSSSHHSESSSTISSRTLTDKHNTSSDRASLSSQLSASCSKGKTKPQKPRRMPKTPPSTPEPAERKIEPDASIEQVCHDDVASAPPADKVPEKKELRRLYPQVDGDVVAGGVSLGYISLSFDSPGMLQEGNMIQVLGSVGHSRESDVDTGTYVCLDEVKKDGVPGISTDEGPGHATQLASQADPQPSPTATVTREQQPHMSSTSDCAPRVGVNVRGGGLPLRTVPLERTMACQMELRPPAGFKERDTPEDDVGVVLAVPGRQSNSCNVDNIIVAAGTRDGDAAIDNRENVAHNAGSDGPNADSPGGEVAITSPRFPVPQMPLPAPDVASDKGGTTEGKNIYLPGAPDTVTDVTSQESDTSGMVRPASDRVKNGPSGGELQSSTSESETSSSSGSGFRKYKTKVKIEKPKRKGKDKASKDMKKDIVVENEANQISKSTFPQNLLNMKDPEPPAGIRRAEKVENISKSVDDRRLETLDAGTSSGGRPSPVTGHVKSEHGTNISGIGLKAPGLEAESELKVHAPAICPPAISVQGEGSGKPHVEGNVSAPQQTVHVPVPVLGMSTVSQGDASRPHSSLKDRGMSSDSESSFSSTDDIRKKTGKKHRFSEYSSEGTCDRSLSPFTPLSSHSPLNVSQTLAATSNSNLNGFDTLEASFTHSAPSRVMEADVPAIVRHRGHFVVVAIDFGTTFSGYALSFVRDPESVHMMRNWEGGDPGVINQKTPTTILLTPEGHLDSFGFTARDRYHNLTPDEARKWMYFERFKMVLHHNADLTKDTMLTASNGEMFPALRVFALALRFFKEHALQQLSDQSGITVINDDVRWVITVPAIWKAPAKQFMRQAAYEADLVSPDCPDQLLIALEPEAASIYCRKLRMYQLIPEYPERLPLQSPRYSLPVPINDGLACTDVRDGTRYMVVDCGGGTVDITVHELGNDNKLTELYKATGGPYGATAVDDEFVNLLCDIFGHDFIAHYRAKYPVGWVNLMINFESRKRSASPYKNNSLNVSLPFTFIDYFKKQKGGHIDSVVKRYGNKEICWSSEGMLRLSPHAMRCLFVPVMEKIKHAIGDVLNNPDARHLKFLFLVGGFAESATLQYEVRKEFSAILKVLIPTGVSLAILKGAVLFGLDPTVVNIRRSRLTYGVGVLNRFNQSRHPSSKLVHRDGVDWCTDVFDVFVHEDEPITLGDTVIRSYTPAKANQMVSVIHIYSSDSKDSAFITDPGVRKCGSLCLDLSDEDADHLPTRREIQARMMFGDTEIKVSAMDVATGRCVRASIDFLNK
ncbi:serine-rich adhesin for platelets-like isoform X2 [Haliotis cracherodii]|uniref:serine-rich adhesin for platelets-like isoform X2 n=1 Tax=Haliotis cracherodii TaxID=6455 RepID=UPI0039E9A1C0